MKRDTGTRVSMPGAWGPASTSLLSLRAGHITKRLQWATSTQKTHGQGQPQLFSELTLDLGKATELCRPHLFTCPGSTHLWIVSSSLLSGGARTLSQPVLSLSSGSALHVV